MYLYVSVCLCVHRGLGKEGADVLELELQVLCELPDAWNQIPMVCESGRQSYLLSRLSSPGRFT